MELQHDFGQVLLDKLHEFVRGHVFDAGCRLEVGNTYFSLFVGQEFGDPQDAITISVSPIYPPTPPEVLEYLRITVRGPENRLLKQARLPQDQFLTISMKQADYPYTVEFDFV